MTVVVRTTITKTVVTETEQKYEKTKVISVSGNTEFIKQFGGGNTQENFKKLDAIVETSGTKGTVKGHSESDAHFGFSY